MTHDMLQDLMRALNARDEAYALVTVVRAVAPTSAYVGAQAVIEADGTLHGWIGGGCARSVVIGVAQRAIRSVEPRLVRISNDKVYAAEDIEQYAMSCASNGSVELFVQPYSTRSSLCILGNTPAADEARFLADRLRIRLAAVPDAAPIVLVATQGQGDEEALEAALRSSARQVLMIASHRKAERLRALMRARGVGESLLERLQAPAGPDAGAKTPGEIALVAMVAVLAALRHRTGTGVPQESTDRAVTVARRVEAVGQLKADAAPADGTFINPVCGVAVSITAALHVEQYEGTDYYFCCDGCWTTFRGDPAKYAQRRVAPVPALP